MSEGAAAPRVGVVTGTRAEYGLLSGLLRRLAADGGLDLRLYVTGAHLSPHFGETWRDIERDGHKIAAKIPLPLGAGSPAEIAAGMAEAARGAAAAFAAQPLEMLVVLGDRYELLPFCQTALVMGIPIAHISGGDVTEGAMDDAIRHAITKMASLHFPGSVTAARRIAQMGEPEERIILVGELGIDNFLNTPVPTRAELAADLGLDAARPWALVTWHPETRAPLAYNVAAARDLVAALAACGTWVEERPTQAAGRQPQGEEGQTQAAGRQAEAAFAGARRERRAGALQVLITFANADPGGREINAIMADAARRWPQLFVARENVGMRRYMGLLREAAFMAGNSSSGIFEGPAARLPTLNIGDRQKGRELAPNIVQCAASRTAIEAGLARLRTPDFVARLAEVTNPYGDGHAAERIHAAIRAWLGAGRRAELLRKSFITLGGG